MKSRNYILAGAAIVVLILAAWWMRRPAILTPVAPPVVEATNSIAPPTPVLTNALPNALPTNPLPSSSQTITATNDLAAANKAYQQGLMSKEDLIKTIVAEQNKQPQDFYGKVIDQTGEPVTGAAVNGELMIDTGEDLKTKEVHTTQTDAAGEFEFTGLQGRELAVVPSKAGYELARNTTAMQLPEGGKTSPSNRAIFTMWKLKGAEPMTHADIHAYIPCDGRVTRFDLLTGKKSAGGDLVVKLTRNPVDIVRGKPFDWTVTIAIQNGGVQRMADLYPNEAPADGYQPEMTFDFPADMPNWAYSFAPSFYFESGNGQVYGRMSVKIMADFQPPPTLFDAEIYANPAGSRDLEFDPSKQIR